jgi:Cas7 group CRISPR-associated protein Csh2
MTAESKTNAVQFNRGTGLIVIEVRYSNPNGDPDAESEPRTIQADGRGLISPVSFKRKLRDLVEDHDSPAWQAAKNSLALDDGRRYEILEKRGRDRQSISKLSAADFTNTFWDARIFGNTFLESMKSDSEEQNKKNTKSGGKAHFIRTGMVQFGPGISVAPIEIERLTLTNKAGVEDDKDRGMAPLGWRIVCHAVYAMPFFVNPMMSKTTGCDIQDINLMKYLIPYAYSNTASVSRPFVEIRHAWFAEHQSPLGSCPDSFIVDALMPKKIDGSPDEPSTSISEYDIPTELPPDIRERLKSFEDLCVKQWA